MIFYFHLGPRGVRVSVILSQFLLPIAVLTIRSEDDSSRAWVFGEVGGFNLRRVLIWSERWERSRRRNIWAR
jgi:hypothetical protein